MNHKEYLQAKAYVEEHAKRDEKGGIIHVESQVWGIRHRMRDCVAYVQDTVIETEESFNLLESGFYWCYYEKQWRPCDIINPDGDIYFTGQDWDECFEKGMKFKFMEKPDG